MGVRVEETMVLSGRGVECEMWTFRSLKDQRVIVGTSPNDSACVATGLGERQSAAYRALS